MGQHMPVPTFSFQSDKFDKFIESGSSGFTHIFKVLGSRENNKLGVPIVPSAVI
jgi:hypothetical protein